MDRTPAMASGENGIRTRDAGFPTYRISNPALSATQPSLRVSTSPDQNIVGHCEKASPDKASPFSSGPVSRDAAIL